MINFYSIGRQMYRLNNWREIHRLIVFVCRAYLQYPVIKDLYEFFLQDELRRDIISYNKFPIEQATRAFFFKGSTLLQRSNLIKYHFAYLQEKLKPEVINEIYHYQANCLWKAPDDDVDWHTVLMYHTGQRKEGLMALEMRFNNCSLYQMMFWLNKNEHGEAALWIGAMQGPNVVNAKDLVKEVTKRAYRYRTKNLMLYMTMAVARNLQIKHIYAVSNEGYYAMNHIRRDRKLKTDFGSFWEEVGGHITDDERFYELPLREIRKTMEEIPTRKRAAYRKRFLFQDDVDAQINVNMRKIMRKSGI